MPRPAGWWSESVTDLGRHDVHCLGAKRFIGWLPQLPNGDMLGGLGQDTATPPAGVGAITAGEAIGAKLQ